MSDCKPIRGMFNTKPAGKWDEAYPSGNGIHGVLVMGEPYDETLIFNHERLFLPLPANFNSDIPDMSDQLPNLRSMLREGRYKEATAAYLDKMTERGFPADLIWTDPFHPAFDLLIHTGENGEIENYRRSINFETGEILVEWEDERGAFQRRIFVSRDCNSVVLSLKAPACGKLDCSLRLAEHPGGVYIGPACIKAEEGWLLFRSFYSVGGGGYEGVVRIAHTGGTAEMLNDGVVFHDVDGALVIVRITPFRKDTPEYIASSASLVKNELAALPADYQTLLENHAAIYGELFRRVELDLYSENERELSNEALLDMVRDGNVTKAFIERMHDFGRYLLISSSGQLPPNLQGVWNGIWNPPWSSDYTLDENLQMMMWQVLPGNLPELAQSYFNLIESWTDDWKTNARLYYGCRGIFSSIRSSRNGLHKHFSEDYPLMFWTAGAGWLGQMFYDYWLFTGDEQFLKDRAVPYLREVALFYEDFLVTGPDGKYEFIPSYSPENTPLNSDSPTAVNSTMDIAVAREVLSNLVKACETIGMDQQDTCKWRRMLDKLPDYLVNHDGAIMEWACPGFEDDYHHRHSSHLYPVFPGFEVTREETPELYQACLRAAELRLTDGIEAITGWGLAHLANSSARLKDGNLVYLSLSRIIRKFLLPNLFTCHNEGNLFQMDANLGFTAAILEMLVFSKPGWIELLPALPAELPKGRISGVLCRGWIKLDSMCWDMDIKQIIIELCSDTDQTIILKMPDRISSAIDTGKPAEALTDPAAPTNDSAEFEIDPCDAFRLRISFKAGDIRNIKIIMA